MQHLWFTADRRLQYEGERLFCSTLQWMHDLWPPLFSFIWRIPQTEAEWCRVFFQWSYGITPSSSSSCEDGQVHEEPSGLHRAGRNVTENSGPKIQHSVWALLPTSKHKRKDGPVRFYCEDERLKLNAEPDKLGTGTRVMTSSKKKCNFPWISQELINIRKNKNWN